MSAKCLDPLTARYLLTRLELILNGNCASMHKRLQALLRLVAVAPVDGTRKRTSADPNCTRPSDAGAAVRHKSPSNYGEKKQPVCSRSPGVMQSVVTTVREHSIRVSSLNKRHQEWPQSWRKSTPRVAMGTRQRAQRSSWPTSTGKGSGSLSTWLFSGTNSLPLRESATGNERYAFLGMTSRNLSESIRAYSHTSACSSITLKHRQALSQQRLPGAGTCGS